MVNTAEEYEQDKRLKEAYELYDDIYVIDEELRYSRRHTKPGYMSKNVALYFTWLCDKALIELENMDKAIGRISDSIVEPPKTEAESWMNDAKRECIKIIQECLGGKA